MSFGLTNASVTFMDFFNQVFYQFLDLFVIILLMIFLVYSKSEADHADYLRLVLQTLKDQ